MSFICKFCNQEAHSLNSKEKKYKRYYCANNHPRTSFRVNIFNNEIIDLFSEIILSSTPSIAHFQVIEYEWETDYKEIISNISLRYDYKMERDVKEIASINYNICTDVEKENYEKLVDRFFHDKNFVNYVKKLILCS